MTDTCTDEARRIIRGVYFFEVFVLANLVLAHLVIGHPRIIRDVLPNEIVGILPVLIVETIAGVAIRLGIAAARGRARAYLAAIRSRTWLTDTARLLLFSFLIVHVYTWLKIMVPLLHPRLFDQQLWDLDSALLGGHSPNVLLLSMFSNATFLHLIDWTYGRLFEASLAFAFVFFLSLPDRTSRVAFTNASAVLWIAGAWLYLAVPSLGPVFYFRDVWAPYVPLMHDTFAGQHALMHNYNVVRGYARGTINILLGIGAFPSLHVAYEALLWLCVRRLTKWGGIVFGVLFLIMFFGAVITGWHYLIDALAGVAMAAACYWAFFVRFFRLDEHAPH